MNFSHDELISILVKSYSNFKGIDARIKDLTIVSADESDIPEIGDVVGIKDVNFLKYFSDDIYIYLLNKEESLRLLLMFGDRCQNPKDIQCYIKKYKQSKYGNIFSIVNDVTDTMDSLVLEVNFDVVSQEDAVDMLSFLFSVLTRKDFVDCAYPMLRYFDRYLENIAI